MMQRKLRILTFSSLYPSSARPAHGIFVETRLRKLLESGRVEARVIAPVPWFFSTAPRFGEYARMAATPARETRSGIDILHPRYALLPRVGMSSAPFTMALGALSAVRQVLREGFDFDLVDAHYFYPDGVAAALLAAVFGKPFVCTARGSDITQLPDFRIPRALIRWTARRASASIGVCQALCDEMRRLDLPTPELLALRNGVDLERFTPLDRAKCREKLHIDQRETLLSVGHLIERKGHHLTIEALAGMPDSQLIIVGEGEKRAELERLADRHGVSGRVRFAGQVPQSELKDYFSAADFTVLASSREGWANVLLESMACGTPVIASNVWGTPEVVAAPEAGVLMRDLSAAAIVEAAGIVRASGIDRAATRRYAEQFGWDPTTRGQVDLFSRIAGIGASA